MRATTVTWILSNRSGAAAGGHRPDFYPPSTRPVSRWSQVTGGDLAAAWNRWHFACGLRPRESEHARTSETMIAPMPARNSRIAPVPSRMAAGASFLLLVLLACGNGTIDLFSPQSGQPTADAASQDQIANDLASANQNESGEATADAASHAQIAEYDQIAEDAATANQNEGGANVGCLLDADCTSSDVPRCEPALHVCVECVGLTGDCANQSKSRCNRVTNKCALPCATNGDCASGVCDTGQGVCAQCLNDSQCKPDNPRCVQERCVGCLSAQDCPPREHCWQTACVACVTDADCPEGGTCSTDHACN
jgi:hypothetical protein